MPTAMRILYPVTWAQLGRSASQAQAVATAAALARRGAEVTLMLPRGPTDPVLTAAEVRRWFAAEGDFAVVQRASHWAGDGFFTTLRWLRQVFRDPAIG